MTRVCVDDQVSEFSLGADNRLADVVQMVASTLPPNRVVKEILLDGCHLSKAQRGQALHSLLGEIKELQIRTADRQVWAANGLDMAMNSIERLQRTLIRVAEMCYETDKTQANRLLSPCIEGLELFLENIMITRSAMNLDFSRIEVEGVTLARLEQQLFRSLDSLTELFANGDYDGLVDALEYGVLTNLSSWARGLRQLRVLSHSNA